MVSQGGFPHYILSGNSYELGLSHGQILAEKIHKVWEFYRSTLKSITDHEIEKYLVPIEYEIKKQFPHLIEEVRGIAQGCGLKYWQLLALNSRTELLQLLDLPPHECTTIYFAKSSILGQNWDFAQALEQYTVILTIDTGYNKFLMLTEPGMVGKIGFNKHGLGVSLNRLTSKRRLEGVPVHFLLRVALESNTLTDFLNKIKTIKIGSESCIIIANDKGEGFCGEISGERWQEHRNHSDYLIHSNHYIAMPEEEYSNAEDIEHSATRFDRAQQLTATSTQESWRDMFEILSDRTHPKYPICRDYEPSATLGTSGTISTVIMDLPARTMHYSPGNPHLNALREIIL